ncbi:MAG: UDP-N-acetylglucosamine--N-acetylmuramyl-(pentapeptide) pyrophosphoryl-undecaprenol N-acetylglucosamine transferase [Phycisphaerales bacterium]
METVTFVFAGGGSGGHLFPGLAIGEQLRELMGERAELLFLCSDRAVDRDVLTPEGVRFEALAAKPLGIRPRALWRFLKGWGPSVRKTRKMLREAKRHGPVHLIAMGGFVAAPAVQAARVERVPSTIVNLDAVPGKANRLIARRVTGGAGAYTVVACKDYPKWQVVPPIVRKAAVNTLPRDACRAALGIDARQPVLMVTGGSQGSATINRLVMDIASHPSRSLAGWHILHQCGAPKVGGRGPSREELVEAYRAAGVAATVEPLVRTMGLWWGAAELAVSSAGAGAVAEAWCNRTPTVFLPYPYHADQHQKLNAAALVRASAAVITTDHIDASKNMTESAPVILRLLASADERGRLRSALDRLGPADGARRIAEGLSARHRPGQ